MSKYWIKPFLVYKSHIFPPFQKPIRKKFQFLMYKNSDLDSFRAIKMSKLLDRDQVRRLKTQIIIHNQKINEKLLNYHKKYIEPMENCPDYIQELFAYAVAKTQYFEKQSLILDSPKQRYHLDKQQVAKLWRSYEKKRDLQKKLPKDKNFQRKQQQKEQKKKTIKKTSQKEITNKQSEKNHKKLLQIIYTSLYPSQRLYISQSTKHRYNSYIAQHPFLLEQIFNQKISRIKQFYIFTPIQLLQSQNSHLNMKQASNQYQNNVTLRLKVNQEFRQIVANREMELATLKQKHQVQTSHLYMNYRAQYYFPEKYKNFYSMIVG